ncbi:hypothetical protein WMF18_16665 [Sorangium sp. So ce315]
MSRRVRPRVRAAALDHPSAVSIFDTGELMLNVRNLRNSWRQRPRSR